MFFRIVRNDMLMTLKKQSLLQFLFIMFWSYLLVFNLPGTYAAERVEGEVSATEVDYALRDALKSGNIEIFEHSLIRGGDPTVWFENSPYGWVFCAATENGREEYLNLIVRKGFDVNFRQKNIHATSSLPLTCAVQFDNLNALKILIAAGADPAVRMCLDCDRRSPMSVFAEAAIVSKYHLAIWLLDKGDYSDEQIETVIYGLESFPIDENNPNNAFRLELSDRIRELGFDVNPWTEEERVE